MSINKKPEAAACFRPDRRQFLGLAARTLAASAILTAAGGMGRWSTHSVFAADNPSATANTAFGRIRGFMDAGVNVFRGVPYGASTAGANRFLPARDPEPWTDIRDTIEYGESAAQVQGGRSVGSEDCLVLNVFTPAVGDNRRRPVMVWLHGGGFSTLSGSSPMYDGVNLCNRGDVVVVSLNHRLNVFGFLHLGDLLDEPYAQSGNVGMLDTVHALHWIRDNIAEFGGDSNNITIFGESGGGRKVSTLLAMPAAQSYFHKAIIQSGPGMTLQPRDRATEMSLALFRELSLRPDQIDVLQTLPMNTILSAYTVVEGNLDGDSRFRGVSEQHGFVPTVGIESLPAFAFNPVATEISAHVPILIGSNKHEYAYFGGRDPVVQQGNLTEEQLRSRVEAIAGNATDRVLDVYRRNYPDTSPSWRWVLLTSDRTYRFDSITIAQRKAAANKAPAYMYFFEWETPHNDMKAHHALEISFVFDNTTKVPAMSGGGPAAAALADKMSDAWIAFARTGNPNTNKLPYWPSYDTTSRNTMVFNNESRIISDPDAEVRQLWSTL